VPPFAVSSALDVLNQWAAYFCVTFLLSVSWINYNRVTVEEEKFNPEEHIALRFYDSEYGIDVSQYSLSNKHRNVGTNFIQRYFKSIVNGLKLKRWRVGFGLLFTVAISASVWFTTDGMCIASHPVAITTRFTRLFSPEMCKSKEICNVYFTLPEDPSRAMIVNFHTAEKPQRGFVEVSLLGFGNVSTVEASWFKFEELREVDRWIFWADVTNLLPGHSYEFKLAYVNTKDEVVYAKETFKVRTVPATGNVTFVEGGDMQNDARGIQMSKVAASHDPYFVLFGGDLAYANSNLYCYRRWDFFFSNWNEYMKTPSGFSIPLSVTLGNHEAGGDRLRSRTDLKFYLDYFPQQLGLQSVPTIERPLYHAHQIADHTLSLMLDSALVEPMTGRQAEWMDQHFQNTTMVNKLAVYHYPLYPAVTYAHFVAAQDKATWLDVFERNNLTIGFENHFHCLKRSKPIRGGKVADDGIVYLGDGAWGIDGTAVFMNPDSWWIEKAVLKPHVYVVTTSKQGVTATAFDNNNQILTSYSKIHN
jgi:hypothetical protein